MKRLAGREGKGVSSWPCSGRNGFEKAKDCWIRGISVESPEKAGEFLEEPLFCFSPPKEIKAQRERHIVWE